MAPRDPTEEHRVVTPLELFFDLCFVVAVAQAGNRLHHALSEGHVAEGAVAYASVFFAIWWAWMNFTWFASAYDSDDVPYRLATLVQIAGALILAAGVPRAFDDRDFGVVTLGYVVMRVALVGQWLRAARSNPAGRRTALRFAGGVTAAQAGWVGVLAVPREWYLAGAVIMAGVELLVPVWAERATPTTWHPRHIAERFGLFTIIVLGEAVLAATLAIQSALDAGEGSLDLVAVVGGGLLTVFGMWWLYFAKPAERLLDSNRRAFRWGYGHLFVFASAAAVGSGLAVAVDRVTGHAHLSYRAAAATFTVPVALYLLVVWVVHLGPHRERSIRRVLVPGAALSVLAATAAGYPVLVTGLLVATLVAVSQVMAARGRHPRTSATGSRRTSA
ncbi:MAG: low temperature requirement protein A [Actinomycetota bacterium]